MNFEKITPAKTPENNDSIEDNEGTKALREAIETEEGFMTKFGRKTHGLAYILPLLTTLAATTIPETASADSTYRHAPEEYKKMRESGIYSRNPRIQSRMERAQREHNEDKQMTSETLNEAGELAAKMGIPFNPEKYDIYAEETNRIPTTINGHAVPLELLEDADRENVEQARGWGKPVNSSLNKKAFEVPEEGIITSGEIFMNADDF